MSLGQLDVKSVSARRPLLRTQPSARSSAADEVYNSCPETNDSDTPEHLEPDDDEDPDEHWSIVSSEPISAITVVRWAPVSASGVPTAPADSTSGVGQQRNETPPVDSSGLRDQSSDDDQNTPQKPSIRPIKPAVDARAFPLVTVPSPPPPRESLHGRADMQATSQSQPQPRARPQGLRQDLELEQAQNPNQDPEQSQFQAIDPNLFPRRSVIREFDTGHATPGVDDTPYIRFAIDQLTRDEEVKAKQNPTTRFSQDSYPVNRLVNDEGLGYLQELRKERQRATSGEQSENSPLISAGADEKAAPRTPRTPRSANPKTKSMESDIFLPVDEQLPALRYPALTFVPTILRPLSMITLCLLCLLMIAGLMFSAIRALRHGSLLPFDSAHLYDGSEYFVFRFLPQICAAVIMIYVHGVMSGIVRISPYMTMATGNTEQRSKAMFMRLNAQGFLIPEWELFKCGRPLLGCCMIAFWLVLFTIPLQSALFSVVRVNSQWQWTVVQGVAWTLIVIYFLITIAIIVVTVSLFRRPTGLMWDPTSLADIIALLPRSNSLREFAGTEIAYDNEDLRDKLGLSSNRLGYWRTPVRTQGVFYCLGEEGTPRRRYTGDGRREKDVVKYSNSPRPSTVESTDESTFAMKISSASVRFRYIPWFLHDTWAILWAVTGFFLLLALLIVSFLPLTSLLRGFPPLLSPISDSEGFSPANFFYSFLPSALGLLLYLLFQYLDLALRRLQPWSSLASPGGATAESSLLTEYPSIVLPLACGVRAIPRGHWRVAIFSTLSFLFILLPVLSGGLFFAFTALPSGEVLILPDAAAFYVLVVLLIFYFIALLQLLPRRRRFHLPHDVNSLAGTISFLYASDFLRDPPFRAPRSKLDLIDRIESALAKDGTPVRYAFGVFRAGNGNGSEHLGVSRLESVARSEEV